MSQLCIPDFFFFFLAFWDILIVKSWIYINSFFCCYLRNKELRPRDTDYTPALDKVVCTVYVPKCQIGVFALFSDSTADNLLHTSGV